MEENTNPQGSVPNQTIVKPASAKSLNMLFLGAGGIVLLALGLLGGYFLWGNKTGNNSITTLTPTPVKLDLNLNTWKTYINTKHNYSFHYPPDFRIIYDKPNVNDIKELARTDLIATDDTTLSVTLTNREVKDSEFEGLGKPQTKRNATYGELSGVLYETQNTGVAGTKYRFDFVGKHIDNTFWINIGTWRENQAYYKDVFPQILSTFKFTDQAQSEDVSNTLDRQITYSSTAGWNNFSSKAGYSLQYPLKLSDINNLGEVYQDGKCSMTLSQNNGGDWILSLVVPYSGGSRRELYGVDSSSNYQYEDVNIQGKNALLIQKSTKSGAIEASAIVVPDTKYALIVSWTRVSRDSQDFTNLLKSIKIDQSLNASNCGG